LAISASRGTTRSGTICSCATSSPRYLSTRLISFDGDTECVGNYLWK
jgi:hypothetical protein